MSVSLSDRVSGPAPNPRDHPRSDPETAAEDWRSGGFGLYVHWPFCASKCPYCDFNSHVRAEVDQRRWARALSSEIETLADLLGPRSTGSVFFGGGTPSLMAPETVAAVLETVRARFDLARDAEVTLEANPGSVEAGRFRAYAKAGVNRLSIGVQALRDPDLNALGRLHSAAEARNAFDVARAVFDRVSFDLIYARQGQSVADWATELSEALTMGADHLSLYQLTIEPGTAFGARHARGRLKGLPDDDLSADLFETTQELCAAAGLPAYEISNHARPDAECRHNLVYWRYGDYGGVGPGAHGRLTLDGTRHATETARLPEAWLAAVESRGTAIAARKPIPPEEQAREYLLTALRLAEGLDMRRYARLSGRALDPVAVADLEGLALVEQDGTRLRATRRGRAVLNGIIRALDA